MAKVGLGGFDFKIRTKWFFDKPAVMNGVKKARKKVLSRSGGFVRKTAKNSIRKNKKGKPSAPGKPPNTHPPKFFLRNDIIYAYDPTNESVVIGPWRSPWLNELHEKGGTMPMKVLKSKRTGKTILSRTGRATSGWLATGRTVQARYPARPFMGPALERSKEKLAQFWAGQVK